MYYEKAIARPFSDKNKLLVGSLFYMVPWALFALPDQYLVFSTLLSIILYIIGTGYILSSIKSAKMPAWENFDRLFTYGLASYAIAIVYLIPALLIGYMSNALNYLTAFKATVGIATLPAYVFSILRGITPGLTVMKFIVALSIYFIPAALVMYSKNYRFKDAFVCRDLFKQTLNLKYLSAWLIGLIYSILIIIASGILSGLFINTFIPFIIQGFAFFIIGITFMTLFGEVRKYGKKNR